MKGAYCYQELQPMMFRFLTLLFFLSLLEHMTQASNGQSPRFTDSFLKMKRSFVAWPASTPLSLKCNANGTRPLNVGWYKNGIPLQYSDTIFQEPQWNLRLKNPQPLDSGIYTCVVSNGYGVAKHNYSLGIIQSVQSAPVLMPGYPKPRTALVGDSVQLECIEKHHGPVSDYRWLKWESTPPNKPDVDFKSGSFVIIDSKNYEPFSIVIGQRKLYGGRLHLNHVSEQDKGFYTCFVSNNLGYTHSTAYLNVTQVSPTAPPEFIIPKERRRQFVIGTEGRDVNMSCLVRGGSPLVYQWLFEGQVLKADERHELHEAKMVLKNVRYSDMGLYSCSIKNDYGSIVHHFKLHVQRPSHSLPELLPGYPKNKTSIVGETASLFCAEVGRGDLVDYRWLKWHNPRKSYTTSDINNTSLYSVLNPELYQITTKRFSSLRKKGIELKLKNLTMKDQGLYTCFVSNNVGYSLRSAFLSVKHTLKKTSSNPTTANLADIKDHLRCYDYRERLDDDRTVDDGKECNSRGLCGSVHDEKKDSWQLFCDETELCKESGISDGGCTNVTINGEKVKLCCCDYHLCNKLFVKSSKAIEQRSQLMTLIFLVALIVTFLIMLAILTYRLRQRKPTTGLKGSIVHSIIPPRKSTKRIIMQTKWLKEDI